MGLLDSILGMVSGGQSGGGGNAALLNAVLGMLANSGQGGAGAGAAGGPLSGLGGLGGLIGKFQQAGLGDVMSSWTGTGQNQPISPDQLHNTLGADLIGSLAGQLGMSHGDVASQLSQLLPQVIDRLTPNGQVPSGNLGSASDLFAMLGPR